MVKLNNFLKKITHKRYGNVFNYILNKYLKTGPNKKIPIIPFLLRPLQEKDYNPYPKSWKQVPPSFVGVGAPKSGTSWLASLIFQHPEIAYHRFYDSRTPVSKELEYFVHFSFKEFTDHDKQQYLRAFYAPEGKITGEWSTLYLCSPLACRYLAETAPECKILIILRNPIDRTISHLNHLMTNRAKVFNVPEELSHFYFIFSATPETILHSMYGYGLRELLKYFERDKILIVQYEKLCKKPDSILKDIFSFLNVRSDFNVSGLMKKINYLDYVISKPNQQVRTNLSEYFYNDVLLLCELWPEIDLNFWPEFISKENNF